MSQVRTTRWPDERPGGEWRTRIRLPSDDLARAWAHFLGRVPWAAMVTLTFDLKRIFPVGQTRASREAWWWCCSLGRIFRRPVAWLYTTERGRSGAWHAHALVAGLSVAEVNSAANMWRVGTGLADVREVWDGQGAVRYVSKRIRYDTEVVFSETIGMYQDRLRREEAGRGTAGGRVHVSAASEGTDSLAISSRDRVDGPGERCKQASSGTDPHYHELLGQLFDGYFHELGRGKIGPPKDEGRVRSS